METILIIIFLVVIQVVWNVIQSALNCFEITLEKEVKNIDGKDITTIIVKGKGILPLEGSSNPEATFISTVWDITDGKKSPVLCFIPNLQIKGRYFLEKTIPVPYDKTIIKEWTPVGYIFPEACVFPKSKNRHLEVHLSILNNSYKVVQTYSSTIQFYNHQKGYEEITEDKIKFFKIKIQTLMKIAMADEKLDNKEKDFLSKQIEEFLENYEDEEREELKKEMNELLKQSYMDVCFEKMDLSSLLSFFNQEATQADKYDLIQNCVNMMSIDGEINEKELMVIDEISDYLELDYKKVNELKDIHILKGSNLNSSSPESILGIKPSWSDTEIHSHLRKEFIKWNSRMQNCSDKKERDHIQYMLDLISKMRLKYEKKAG